MIEQIRPFVSATLVATMLTGCVTMPTGDSNGPGSGTSNAAANAPNPEREIFIQAVMVGTGVGAAGGAAAGYAIAGRDHGVAGALVGGALGALVGALAGRAVAEQQIKNLHDHQFSNQQLATLLQTAESRNQEVAQYNQGLEREIAGLKRQSKAVQGQLASAKLKEAKQKRDYVQGLIANRTELAAKLSAPQREQYEKTLTVLKRDAERLDSSVNRLEMMEAGVVGGAKTTGVPRPVIRGTLALAVPVG